MVRKCAIDMVNVILDHFELNCWFLREDLHLVKRCDLLVCENSFLVLDEPYCSTIVINRAMS